MISPFTDNPPFPVKDFIVLTVQMRSFPAFNQKKPSRLGGKKCTPFDEVWTVQMKNLDMWPGAAED